MPDQFVVALPYILVAAGIGILGGITALFWCPGLYIRSAVQHFAAGAVLAAAAAVDTLLDGVVAGAGFSTSSDLGTLLVIALALEPPVPNLVGGNRAPGKQIEEVAVPCHEKPVPHNHPVCGDFWACVHFS